MAINYERLISRRIARQVSVLLDLAGIKMSVNKIARFGILGFFIIFIATGAVLFLDKINLLFSTLLAFAAGGMYVVAIYVIINYKIDGRKTKLEKIMPDYFQIASANLRSGISLDRAMLLAARPEFSFFSDDIKDMNRKVFGGETFENALTALGAKYKSLSLQHAIRMMLEAQKYGGAMADLMDQISKDLRSQQMMQTEVAGQLFMYSIFIAFAGLIAAPVLYGLTSQMIGITDTVWKGILASNPGGLPTTGLSFLKPSPPKISPGLYHSFSILAIIVITGFASLIMAAIQSGSPVKGIKYLPLFIIVGIGIYIVVGAMIASLFSSIG